MFSRRIAVGAVAVGAAAAAVLTAVPAGAAVSNVRITAGGSSSGSATFSVSSGSIALIDLTTPKNGSCVSSSLSGGSATLGTHANPAASIAGTSSTTSFSNCVVNVGANVPITITGGSASGSPWRVQADSQTTNPSNPSNNPLPPSNPVSGQTTVGTVYNINVNVSSSSCSFPVTGSISGATYTNTSSGATLTLPAKTLSTSNLTVGTITYLNGATTCIANTVHTGDKISFATTYTINASSNPLWANAA